mgnify:CR=1 FL=1
MLLNYVLILTAALGGSQHTPSGETFFFKLLCPQPLTGIIIGKGGANLTQLTYASGTKIKLSKNDEYFPGTIDRPMLCKSSYKNQYILYLFVTNF